MNRDVATVSLHDDEELIIATDNSGSIGLRAHDDVHVPYEVVAYFNFRVAWMECVAAGAQPFSVIVHNFAGGEAWDALLKGIKQGLTELNVTDIEITGSTETNFSLLQSAVGLAVIGRRDKYTQDIFKRDDNARLETAIIGEPLVGNEVIENKRAIAPLKLFQWLAEQEEVVTLLPVGSKGISYELNALFTGKEITFSSDIDMQKTSGPATCFIVVYEEGFAHQVKQKADYLFHPVIIKKVNQNGRCSENRHSL